MNETKEKLATMDIDNQIIYLFNMLTEDNKKLVLQKAKDLIDKKDTGRTSEI